MTRHRWELALAVLFLVVGILATTSSIRLNSYIKQTLPRDQAQEQCNTETIAVLKSWVNSRMERDNAMDARDDAAVAALNDMLTGQQPTNEELSAWRDAIATDRRIRAQAGEDRIPLPDC